MNNDAIIAVLIAMLIICTAVIIRAIIEIGICDDMIEYLSNQLDEKEKKEKNHERLL